MTLSKIRNMFSNSENLRIGYIGLGKMGLNMTKNAITDMRL